MTPKQQEVYNDIVLWRDPWAGVRDKDGNAIAGRRKTLGSLMRKGLIEVNENWSVAWPTKEA